MCCYVLTHFVFNLANQLRYFIFLKDFRMKSGFAEYLDGIVICPQKRMILRRAHDEMQFQVALNAIMNRLKMPAPAGLVFYAFSVC